MKKLIFAFLAVLCVVMASAQQIAKNKNNYRNEIRTERREKDKDFIKAENSPLDEISKKSFRGLNYFPVSEKYRVKARLQFYDNPDTILMKTTTDRLPQYLVYAKATFTLDGKQLELTVYRNVSLMKKKGYEDYLFVPFRDLTTGEKSYGGGRYVDARIPEGTDFVIDFNRAYNPYCVYSKRYSCPVPPDGNYLEIAIEAGEKNYAH